MTLNEEDVTPDDALQEYQEVRALNGRSVFSIEVSCRSSKRCFISVKNTSSRRGLRPIRRGIHFNEYAKAISRRKVILPKATSSLADTVNADANLGVGTSEHQISNAPEESGQMSNTLGCPWVDTDKTTKQICGNPVPAEIRAILDHLSSEHDVRGEEKKVIVCGWATDSGVCGRSFQRRHAKRHMESHLHLRYPCDYCSKDFSRADLLTEHVRDKHQV